MPTELLELRGAGEAAMQFMSLWLSSANAVAGRARSVSSAEADKLTTQTVRFWTKAWLSAAS
jgi:hypothetical protein